MPFTNLPHTAHGFFTAAFGMRRCLSSRAGGFVHWPGLCTRVCCAAILHMALKQTSADPSDTHHDYCVQRLVHV